jgi:calcium-dependent protein kinase
VDRRQRQMCIRDRLRKSHMDEDEKKMLFNEINNLKDMDHPNILKMYEFFEDEKRYYIVTDIC